MAEAMAMPRQRRVHAVVRSGAIVRLLGFLSAPFYLWIHHLQAQNKSAAAFAMPRMHMGQMHRYWSFPLMGPHFGNDVALPGKGRYQLSLLIGPPHGARHMEYAKVSLKPRRVTMAFTWKGKG